MSTRPVLAALKGMPTSDGAGVKMTRLLGTPQAQMFDPFLMLDHFGSEAADDYLAGFPDHPHRGFETVTYMLDGKMRHADNKGHSGVIGPGGVQWMRAGRGLVHSEMPEQTQGAMRGFQLWVNLPSHLKMSDPLYQEFSADQIPVETRDDGAVIKVVAGTTRQGTAGAVQAAIQPTYFDVSLPKGAVFDEPVPAGHAVMLALYEGAVRVGGDIVEAVSAVFLGPEGDTVRVEAIDDARFLFLAGKPIQEPVAWAGPFVMNSREEIEQAYQDFQAGKF
jgi:redox-sensitive bicupin YhaK (pirin superfamily)